MATIVPPELLLVGAGVALLATVAAGVWGWRESLRQVSFGLALSFAGAAPLVAILALLQAQFELLLAAAALVLMALTSLLLSHFATGEPDDSYPFPEPPH